MNVIEEAIIYATIMHQGAVRKNGITPYILHPLEVAQIISGLTDDQEVIAAGVLHDIVEDTDGSMKEIYARFGDRIAHLVESETENKYEGIDKSLTWKRRKEETLAFLRNSTDIGVKIMWLGDKLSNIRSLAGAYSEKGEAIWDTFNQKDPEMHKWYYTQIAEILEINLNKTSAFKEFIKHINFIWPGTFEAEKTRYKKYRTYSIEGCPVIGRGAKSIVYRYDDELAIKVYNENNTYKDIERENLLAKKAFVAGMPTAISFGIVDVGGRYGSMFELLDSSSISACIAKDESTISYYANLMADLAKNIHKLTEEDLDVDLPDFMNEVQHWVDGGIAKEDAEVTNKVNELLKALPKRDTIIHGDFHTGNIMIQNGEPLMIDMDRLSVCHPIIELGSIYMFYKGFGEIDPSMIENFMGYSFETSKSFYHEFMADYLETNDDEKIKEVEEKAALICYIRLMRRVYKKGSNLSEENKKARDYYMERIKDILGKIKTLDF